MFSAMRVKATVVGNTLVVDSDIGLAEGARVEVVLRAVGDDESLLGMCPTKTGQSFRPRWMRLRRPKACRLRSPSLNSGR